MANIIINAAVTTLLVFFGYVFINRSIERKLAEPSNPLDIKSQNTGAISLDENNIAPPNGNQALSVLQKYATSDSSFKLVFVDGFIESANNGVISFMVSSINGDKNIGEKDVRIMNITDDIKIFSLRASGDEQKPYIRTEAAKSDLKPKQKISVLIDSKLIPSSEIFPLIINIVPEDYVGKYKEK